MKIDRSNYEIWIIDLLDGNLSDLQIEQLQLFLNENPDLHEEYIELKTLNLIHTDESFPQKEQLKKSTADLSVSQFEYLCTAYLENDLSVAQKSELLEIIGNDPEKKRSFELIQKMRLTPEAYSYKHKKKLIKITPVQKVIRFSLIGLSAAAAVALIITLNLLTPQNLQDKNSASQNIVIDSTLIKLSPVTVSVMPIIVKMPVIKKQKRESLISALQKKSSVITQTDPTYPIPNDSLFSHSGNPQIIITKIPFYAEINLKERSVSNTLVASNPKFIIPAYDDERSKFSKFIVKTFREKILREKVTKDTPLRAYEIAEAGVAGLNKLLGWQMALVEKKDENGELRSVYFSSKILRFNAPVNKNETVQ